jgi:hypothetical protein
MTGETADTTRPRGVVAVELTPQVCCPMLSAVVSCSGKGPAKVTRASPEPPPRILGPGSWRKGLVARARACAAGKCVAVPRSKNKNSGGREMSSPPGLWLAGRAGSCEQRGRDGSGRPRGRRGAAPALGGDALLAPSASGDSGPTPAAASEPPPRDRAGGVVHGEGAGGAAVAESLRARDAGRGACGRRTGLSCGQFRWARTPCAPIRISCVNLYANLGRAARPFGGGRASSVHPSPSANGAGCAPRRCDAL